MYQTKLKELLRGLDVQHPNKHHLCEILLGELAKLHPTPVERSQLTKAFQIAFEHHRTTPPRESGEAYFFHPLRVTLRTIWEQQDDDVRDIQSLTLLLLHDNVEEARRKDFFSPIQVQLEVGFSLPPLVICELNEFTKFKEIGETSESYCRRLSKTVLWRTLYGKFADRIDNMWTMDAMSPLQQRSKISETELWFPIFKERLSVLIAYEVKQKRLTEKWLHVPARQLERLSSVVDRKKNKYGLS